LKIYPYQPGTVGSPVATYLSGAGPFGPETEPPPTRFVDAVHKSFNTIPPVDDSYWDLINELVQTEPVEAGNPEILGLLASVGIVNGQPFAPDARMRKILSDAVKVGNATARTLSLNPREQEGWAFYPDSAWFNMMWEGYQFLTPPPLITPNGVEQSRATVPASTTPASRSSTRTPASLRRCVCDSPGSARNTSSPHATLVATTSTVRAPTGSRCRPTSPRAGSGR
jgi:hypothetical protein